MTIPEMSTEPSEVVEMALAHTIKNQTEAAYRRGDLFEKRSRLMEAWARHFDTAVSAMDGSNVVLIQSHQNKEA